MSSNNKSNVVSGATEAFEIGAKRDVEESQPELRSVPFTTSVAASMFAGPSFDGPIFGKKEPPIGLGKPAPVTSRSSSIAVKQVWNEIWRLTDPLELVPADFPLERTHREIKGCTAMEVAERISKTLRSLSVDAEYDGEKAKAKCTTGDSVSFRIRLFAGGDGGIPVVVEVQRRCGSASSFMRVCRSILNGAEGAEIKAETEPARKKLPGFLKTPIGDMKCLKGLPLKIDPDVQMNSDLEKSMELLRSKQRDTNILGLENLCNLTDPVKTRHDIALKACKAILLEAKCVDIREEVAVMLQKDAFLPEEFDEDAVINLSIQSRQKSLVLLSNTLLLTGKDGCLEDAVKSVKWFSEFLIPSLLDEVKGFASSANNAYEAATGLTSLASCSSVARRIMEEDAAVDILRRAYDYGTFNHELLANESERALHALGQKV